MEEQLTKKLKNSLPTTIVFVLLVVIAGGMISMCILLMMVPGSKCLNAGEPMAVGDVWKEENRFAVWIDEVTEVPAEAVPAQYVATARAGMRYLDVRFSFENIDFPGDLTEQYDSVEPFQVSVNVVGQNSDGENLFKADTQWVPADVVQVLGADSCGVTYDRAVLDGARVAVTEGVTARDNHLYLAVNETSEAYEQLRQVSIRFRVEVERLSTEAGVYYQQRFLLPLTELGL